MKRAIVTLFVCTAIVTLTSACATKKFVREQLGLTEAKITERVDTTDTKLRDTSEKTSVNTQAIEAASQRIQGLDTRVDEAKGLAANAQTSADGAKKDAGDAKMAADNVGNALRETDTRLSQRFANRNNYSQMETMSIFFAFNKSDLEDKGMTDLEDVARALKANPNAIVELQGFADPRGSNRYNYQLTRERVDAVVRYLVQKHGVDLRRIHAVGMGKEIKAAGEKATRDALAKSRRVDVRLLAPQS
jgi:outer membrane protein OmpA-like peptidoglycan-associated protein